MPDNAHANAIHSLLSEIKSWAKALGFADLGVSDMDLSEERQAFEQWLKRGYHGSMHWLENHRDQRFKPPSLVPGTCRILSFRMNYLPQTDSAVETLRSAHKAYISRYALGRDYHKLIRKRLAKLADRIQDYANEHKIVDQKQGRAFVDSAPVLERPIAVKAGLGWVGKHTLTINEDDGSWFFLGEVFTNIPFPIHTERVRNQCGDCEACLQICPTDAFPKPYVLDASRCISYLTIEHKGAIPEPFRQPMGNRIFGCDDCQLVCPWNRHAQHSRESDFQPRHGLNNIELIDLFFWSEHEFLEKTQGSAIRRAGYQKWLENIAIGLGNAEADIRISEALSNRLNEASGALREHILWALHQQKTGAKRKRKLKNPERLA